MSTIVAVVALIFSHRQNVGWKPVILVTRSLMSGMGGSSKFTLSLTVEFWNRQKYPVALRYATADVTGVDLLRKDTRGPNERDFVRNNRAYKETDQLVEPNSSRDVLFEVSFENQSLDALTPIFNLTVCHFDPRRNRTVETRIAHRFFYPELGWKKSLEQRNEIRELFEEMHAEDAERREAVAEKGELKVLARELLDEPRKRLKRNTKTPPN
jgi:hypothetical protein